MNILSKRCGLPWGTSEVLCELPSGHSGSHNANYKFKDDVPYGTKEVTWSEDRHIGMSQIQRFDALFDTLKNLTDKLTYVESTDRPFFKDHINQIVSDIRLLIAIEPTTP